MLQEEELRDAALLIFANKQVRVMLSVSLFLSSSHFFLLLFTGLARSAERGRCVGETAIVKDEGAAVGDLQGLGSQGRRIGARTGLACRHHLRREKISKKHSLESSPELYFICLRIRNRSIEPTSNARCLIHHLSLSDRLLAFAPLAISHNHSSFSPSPCGSHPQQNFFDTVPEVSPATVMTSMPDTRLPSAMAS